MKVVIKEPQKEAKIIEIEDDLKTYKEIIGCSIIDIVPLPDNQDIAIIVDDEGALKNKEPNFWRDIEVIFGTAIFAGVDGENLTDLSEKQINYLLGYYLKYQQISGAIYV